MRWAWGRLRVAAGLLWLAGLTLSAADAPVGGGAGRAEARFQGTGKADSIRISKVVWQTAGAGRGSITFDLACDGVLWRVGLAFAAWAGLRPMTELEFEKACRGPLKPVVDEYARGTAKVVGAEAGKGHYAMKNAGAANETVAWEGENPPGRRNQSFSNSANRRSSNQAVP